MSNGLHTENEAHESPFLKLYTSLKSTELLSRNRDPDMTQNEHVYVICWEADGDVISSKNVNTIEGNVLVNFEVVAAYTDDSIKQKRFTNN